jgi:tetratricopeptide (TPR) repeat protein
MHEVDDELRDIKREIVESRGLVIKTNNLTNALSADVKSIAKRQQSYERRLAWNSATAYVVFVLVVFAALKFAWDARVDSVKSETEQKTQENERLRKEARTALDERQDRERAQAKAAQYYELIRQGKKVEFVEAHEAMKKEQLTRAEQNMFADAVENAKNDLAAQLFDQGLDKARVQRWQEAATAFEESLKYKENSAIAPGVRLGLAQAYRRLGRARDALPLLTALAESAVDKELQDDALYELAKSQEELQAWNEAKASWRALIRRFPESHFTPEGKMMLAQLQLMH